ncbi:LytS/YhcK type 5TM receptor domain-containing protein [Thalassococcus sp. S3]|uniref:LytS/YhcK type 5TM receptor domain-containing protein n=1 Tax=Thalassococcus sp. S3 TaxID=2017482 RepID=UPI001023F62B|nr:LytS/YhcK type 5TM receptor domain-containing protein [Thalassococcus sp. S3]QBF31380.1 hypothetical protein CFI11_09125 [Thalassococcus sp. S3]
MKLDISSILDLTASLGLIVILGYAYAQLRRGLRFPRVSQAFLGLSFGIGAVFQMYRPFEPIEGLIIDLRNIPIALAGAFLGWQAALVCLGVAAAARLGIGGVGMWAGVLGMTIAMSMGLTWAHITRQIDRRSASHMVLLAGLASAHLLGATILPEVSRTWFFSEAALPILLLNMLTIPIVSGVLELERMKFEDEKRLRASISVDPDSGLMTPKTFQRECGIRASAMGDASYTRMLILRLRPNHARHSWGRPALAKQLLAAMHRRLQDAMPQFGFAGTFGTSILLVPLTQADLLDIDDIRVKTRRAVTEEPYILPGGGQQHVTVDMKVMHVPQGVDLETLLGSLSFNSLIKIPRIPKQTGKGKNVTGQPCRLTRSAAPSQARIGKLFDKADLLMAEAERPAD